MRCLLFILISVALFMSVSSSPRPYYYCNNWCGYGCCDNGYGYYGTNVNTINKTYCPKFDCTVRIAFTEECASDDDCKRKETCCENPCYGGRKSCAVHVSENPVATGCKAITNCNQWLNDNQNSVLCDNINDCKRSETCCYNPCKANKVCQKTVETTINNPGSNQGVLGCSNLGLCY